MRRIRYLTARHRTPSTNLILGLILAFNAGAINAGGFLVLSMYTSHMSGFASQLADGLVLSNSTLLLNALGAIFAFMGGAAVCAMLVNLGRLHKLFCVYALPLMLEAILMLAFGVVGAVTMTWNTPFSVPLAVLLLAFIMGLQNAVGSITSAGSIRTTHMTGNMTDLGMEMGRWIFSWRLRGALSSEVARNWRHMGVAAGLIAAFVVGGGVGALGFTYVGFVCVIPLALMLLLLSIPPFLRDVPQPLHFLKRLLKK